jgi:tRNA(fMet)-specific endonuclease VapC
VEAALREIDMPGLDPAAASVYGAIRSRPEAEGRAIAGNDLRIAAQAQTLGATLLTDDERAVHRVEGLVVETWLGA